MTTTAVSTDRLGDILVREGLLSREKLVQALTEHRSRGMPLGYILAKQGLVPEVEITRIVARQLRVPAVDLSRFEVDQKLVRLIPTDIAKRHFVLPLKREGRTLTVAMANPTDQVLLQELRFITRFDLFPVFAGEYTLRNLVEKYYDASDQQLQAILKDMEGMEDVEVVEETDEEAAAQAQIDDARVVKLINGIRTAAVQRGASDIHLECFEHEMRVRYRVDGALLEVMKPPLRLKGAIISRVKILSMLNIAERRIPQDGRLKLKMGNRVIDFRVSTLPTLFGEKIVLRILDKGNLTLDLTTFGFEPKAESELLKAITNPYGMVLVTGPTGSGKTTTLYSALQRINTIDTNIMTAEDPVEYNLHGINQVQVRNEIGLSFAAALRAFLRQDPNIIMIGEIRDLETAGIAIKAALTGHLVLSTLHTNDAPSTVTRMIDMGVEAFNVASALNLILAQRLLRRICGNCKERVELTPEEYEAAKIKPTTKLKELKFTQAQIEAAKERATPEAAPFLKDLTIESTFSQVPIFKGKGCEKCGGSGLKGRQGVYEVLALTPPVRKVIMQNAGATEIKETAIDNGMLTLRMDAWMKVMKGITTFEQMIRETTA